MPDPLTCAPRALLPASLARFCSSFTASNSVSGTRRYFILSNSHQPVNKVHVRATTHRAAPNIALFQLPELVALRTRLVDLPQCDVHEVVAVHKMPVERLAVFELD